MDASGGDIFTKMKGRGASGFHLGKNIPAGGFRAMSVLRRPKT
jgi:hypothetical protein